MQSGENLQDLKLEELSQRLEAVEKDNEQIKRENQLFQSYILRRTKADHKEIDETEDLQKKKQKTRKGQADQPKKLNPEQKYEIANKELETLKFNIEEGREKSETLLERLKAILEGTDLSIAEIRKEAFDFGRFLSAAENGRTGKYDAEKLMKYMDDKFKAKEALIDKLQLKNVSLKTQILKADTQIKHKEEMGDELKFIDFHQLQIENKKHVKDIDERNKKLLALKLNSGKTVQTLNGLKKKLQDALKEQDRIQSEMKIKMQKQEKTVSDIKKTRRVIEKIDINNRQQKGLMEKMRDMADPFKFVEQKNENRELDNRIKQWERKIEIAEVAAKQARMTIRQHGGYINNMDMQYEM